MRANLQKWTVITAIWMAGVVTPAFAEDVPFVGIFHGQAVSAVPTPDPNVLLVTTVGQGHATLLGDFTMISPHLSNLATLQAEGTQNFTAANGDRLTASFAGQFHVLPGGFLAASLACTVTGGTGRFEGARGSYAFDVLFDTATLSDVSIIDGTITLRDE